MLSAQNIQQTLQRLATQRPIFHSEADFQHALAWSVQQADPKAVIRLEVPFRGDDYSEYLDLHIASGDQSYAVELKYKTRRLIHKHAEENFALKQQGAQDLGRYDFLADVGRLERFVAAKHATVGWAILVTNDSSYWSVPKRANTVDEQFRLHEGRLLQGSHAWLGHAAMGTIRNRERPIHLMGRYLAEWKPYSAPSAELGGEFRCLALQVQ